jgi:3-(3-hydroxy-phenyl)propionate hydroxylase/flavoprotein hydroxylase
VDADVVVVGYGPVGMTMAALLARAGHRVVVAERYGGLYNLPRAAIFDDETMRTFAALNLAARLLPTIRVQRTYEWCNAKGEPLFEVQYDEAGRSGWAEWYMMYQPALEDALDDACRKDCAVDVRFGCAAIGFTDHGDHVEVMLEGPEGSAAITAQYVVGCDGGNSFVRQELGVDQFDYGFSEPWLVCDFRFRRPVDVPLARQVGDPRQPVSIISLGPDHHRFSFMLDSPNNFDAERDPERVWQRVAGYLVTDDAELIRAATYVFRSLVADQWRVGRVLLAGDAAHQMPPFLGQGMCSGIRDAQNLAFKLDLLLRGRAHDALLDTYQSEREPHVRNVIEKGIAMGRLQTLRDPQAVAARDSSLLAQRAAGQAPEKIRLPGLGPGFFSGDDGPGRGELAVHGVVDDGITIGLLDQVVGTGFTLLTTADIGRLLRADGTAAALEEGGVRMAALTRYLPSLDGEVLDVDGVYHAWFADLGCVAVLVRPDFYVYGTASDATAAAALSRQLLAAIGARLPAAYSASGHARG